MKKFLRCVTHLKTGETIINNLKISEAYLIGKLAKSGIDGKPKVVRVVVTLTDATKEEYNLIFG